MMDKAVYPDAKSELVRIFDALDPAGLNAPNGEYESEVSMILARRDECGSPEKLRTVIQEIFTSQYDEEIGKEVAENDELLSKLWAAFSSWK